jgi:hypothetical protein
MNALHIVVQTSRKTKHRNSAAETAPQTVPIAPATGANTQTAIATCTSLPPGQQLGKQAQKYRHSQVDCGEILVTEQIESTVRDNEAVMYTFSQLDGSSVARSSEGLQSNDFFPPCPPWAYISSESSVFHCENCAVKGGGKNYKVPMSAALQAGYQTCGHAGLVNVNVEVTLQLEHGKPVGAAEPAVKGARRKSSHAATGKQKIIPNFPLLIDLDQDTALTVRYVRAQ